MITTEEFLQRLQEKTVNGLTNTSIAIDCNIINMKTGEAKALASIALQKPLVEVERHGVHIQIEFKFISALDNDLKLMWNTLELYGKTSNDINIATAETGMFAACAITMIPMHFDGRYFCTAINPIFWALTADEVGKNANVIRLIVNMEDFQILENLNIDVEEIKREARAEIAYEARTNAELMQRAQEQNKEEY